MSNNSSLEQCPNCSSWTTFQCGGYVDDDGKNVKKYICDDCHYEWYE